MTVLFHVPEVLRRYSGGEEIVRVEIGSGIALGAAARPTVRDAAESLFAIHPGLRTRTLTEAGALWPYLVLVRNGRELPRDAALGERLADGDVVEIVGAAEGG